MNSRDKCEICLINMYLIRFLANFKVFWRFLWILRDFADLPEFCGSKTMQNIPVRGWTKAFRELTGTHRITIANNELNNISPHWWYHLFVLFYFVFFAFVCSFLLTRPRDKGEVLRYNEPFILSTLPAVGGDVRIS